MSDSVQAKTPLVSSLRTYLASRRSLLKGAVAGAAGVSGLAVAGSTLLPASTVYAAANAAGACVDTPKTILSVARTAERLAVTFYSNGIKHAGRLGLVGADLENIKAVLVEEQIHEIFFGANGGVALANDFSFPHGADTFNNLDTFIATQQQLEGVFDSAFLVAIREFAQLGLPSLAEIAGQIATIEAEHRALGRQIGGLTPADNWAFSPIFLPSVGAAPALVAKAGYLSPRRGNHYTYQQVSTDDPGVMYRAPFAVGCPS
ncbi:MAG: ferritin-like domain-containing protein [Chloroflexi bacterium]|nr:ferritin-like domain-containing protein [Chloroflexota bacterium]